MRAATALLAAPLLLASTSFVAQEQRWRAAYEQELRAPEGWLSVAGLYWLHEGANTAGSDPHADVRLPSGSPARAGVFRLEHGKPAYVPAGGAPVPVEPDTTGHATVVHIGSLSLTAIQRADRTGIRVRDPNAPARRDFKGSAWFAPDPAWRVKARWFALSRPKKIPITNILDMTTSEICPGYAQWSHNGRVVSLEPLVEGDQLFFMFRDETNGKTTYPAGRFLYADMPKDGQVILDFNQAQNPPCAFTPYATCPLPPPQNRLPFAVPAGEKNYGHHGA